MTEESAATKSDPYMTSIAYASTYNIIKNADKLDEIYKTVDTSTIPGLVGDPETKAPSLVSDLPNYIDGMLKRSIIKRACCQAFTGDNETIKSVPVRMIPPKDYIYKPPKSQADIFAAENQYVDMMVDVPVNKQVCKDFVKHNKRCDAFYNIYCNNIIQEYEDAYGQFDVDDYGLFKEYKPECVCYQPLIKSIKQGIPNAIPTCIFEGCKPGTAAYLDPASRKPDCPKVVCNINLDARNLKGKLNLNANFVQKCGADSKENVNAEVPNAKTTTIQTKETPPPPLPPAEKPSPLPSTKKTSAPKTTTTPPAAKKFNPIIIVGIVICVLLIIAAIIGFVVHKRRS